jgi:hypothetical protein
MRVGAHFRYLLVIALIFVAIPCGVIALTTSGFYYRHSKSRWDFVEEHQFNVRGQDADIVFIGDSSLVHGVSPEQLTRETGWSVYNLGLPVPGLVVDHELLLRRYLAQNKPPRLMVLYLSATTRTRPPYAFPPVWYEGETMLLRYGELRQIADFFRRNETEISRFTALAGLKILTFDWSDRAYYERAKVLDESRGYIPLRWVAAQTLGSDDCPLSSSPIVPDEEFIREFRRETADRGIEAAVYLAPIPDCDRSFAATSSSYARIVDNVPYTLPHDFFMNDPARAHLIPPGAQQNSHIVATFLNHFLAGARTAEATTPRTVQDGMVHP